MSNSAADLSSEHAPLTPFSDERSPSPTARSRRSPRALLVRAAALLVIAATPVMFSFAVDPARLVTTGRAEEAIARTLASGKHVVNFTIYNDRAIEKSLAGMRPRRADVMVLGSSRIQMLRDSAFPGEVMVNAAMSGAVLDDILAVYALYDIVTRRPKRLVIAMDPWSQSYSAPMGWRSLIFERAALLERLGIATSPWKDQYTRTKAVLTQLASPEYFRLSALAFRRSGLSTMKWAATTREQNGPMTKLSNGVVVWPIISEDSAARITARYLQHGFQEDIRFQRLAERRDRHSDVLERFLRYLHDTGVPVTLVLVPYPPEVYAAFTTLAGNPVAVVDTSLRSMAARTGARVIGGYDPARFGVTRRDYYDESHLRPGPLERLVRSAP